MKKQNGREQLGIYNEACRYQKEGERYKMGGDKSTGEEKIYTDKDKQVGKEEMGI